ncbi:MAG: alpha-galactosidase [Propionibacteriaceae bacterium]|jgi:alpha-galactosidase|nr:alpha-galactosidase [Propionibacteriaceae bacterium]
MSEVFRLDTAHTSYWFRVTGQGHLEHLYYGPTLPARQDPDALAVKRTAPIGTSTNYPGADPVYALDNMCLEWSGAGRGDYRETPIETDTATDFRYTGHEYAPAAPDGLPRPHGASQSLRVELADDAVGAALTLHYDVFYDADVIARHAVLSATGGPIQVAKLLSAMVDLPGGDWTLTTLNGAWVKEAHRQALPIGYGIQVNSSTTGSSSNRHNPGVMLAEPGATEEHGRVYGCNLVYSGNHYTAVERSGQDLIRVACGINPAGFGWTLAPGESLATPTVVLTFSDSGYGGASAHFHDFANDHIVPAYWARRPRPVVYNNWEATFFSFDAGKLLKLAKQAKALGAELFVLDDGWFGKRDDDTKGLGDYTVNPRKFPNGLGHFAAQVRKAGLDFGIWVEPEMANPDSDLYRAHPDWAITAPRREPTLGRNQLVLDLTRAEVRDYIVANVGAVIDETGAAYVKWDYNRNLADTDAPGFQHRYLLGLYDVLGRIFGPRPQVLLESCSSGGNRFDLGMLCYGPQIWASDDTDPVERLEIQGGLSLFYPQSTMGAHVSEAPHQQTLRDTPLTTRFNVAAFGDLGYELDLRMLSPVQRKEIKEQLAFYKEHRATFQYGRFRRVDTGMGAKPNKAVWTVSAPGEVIVGVFQTLATAAEGLDRLVVPGMDPATEYRLRTREQSVFLSRFGELIKHIGIRLNPEGMAMTAVNKVYRLTDAVEDYRVFGAALGNGVPLANQFMGTGYNDRVRMLGDFGSNLYLITPTAQTGSTS